MSHDKSTPSRRALLAGAPAVAAAALAGGTVTNALAIAEAKTAEVDPIFALIARSETAFWMVERRYSALDAEGTPEAEAELAALDGAHREIEDELAETEPTTIAGAIALLRYVVWRQGHGTPLDQALKPTVLASALEKIGA